MDPEIKCYMPGIPRAMYMPHPFQIVQSDKYILMAYAFASSNRIIHMDNHQEAPVDSWMGWSNGKWEGDTLVIEVKGLNGQAWFDRAGNYGSENLRIVERLSANGPNHINYEATIEDKTVYPNLGRSAFRFTAVSNGTRSCSTSSAWSSRKRCCTAICASGRSNRNDARAAETGHRWLQNH